MIMATTAIAMYRVIELGLLPGEGATEADAVVVGDTDPEGVVALTETALCPVEP